MTEQEREPTTEEWRAEKKRKKAQMAAMQALPAGQIRTRCGFQFSISAIRQGGAERRIMSRRRNGTNRAAVIIGKNRYKLGRKRIVKTAADAVGHYTYRESDGTYIREQGR